MFGKKETTTSDDAQRRMENQRYQKRLTREVQARARAAEKDRGVYRRRGR